MNKRVELLAPAGDMERLQFAVRYGADAVYLGGQQFGMRARAGNFDEADLRAAVALCKERGVRVYLTCNIVPRNTDLLELPEFMAFAQEIGVDALIVADLGVFQMAGRYAPKLERHISTQAGILNVESARAWHELGASRVILAREMNLAEIAELKAKAPRGLDVEVFVHGAMCVSFSGRCLLSQYMAGRDANQGNCSQPCRWKYHLVEETRPGEYMQITEDGGTHIMNARDLNMIAHLPDLIATGVDSLKIEGRAKSFYYAAVVTNAYRRALDAVMAGEPVDPVWILEAEKVSHRAYSTGFFYDESGGGQHTADALYERGSQVIAVVEDCDETGFATVSQRNRFSVGETVEFITPADRPESFVLTELWDEEGEALTVAPHPMMRVKMKLPRAVPPQSILRVNGTD
ncbi:MAG: U32 family peptidase [Oscillospiraceae bacterium]|nr:U32 family peptidase [Oscillospiraceae bacterium]